MKVWEPDLATALLFVACLVLAAWAALWMLEGWELLPHQRMRFWTVVTLGGAVVVLLGCAVALFVHGG